MADCLHMEFSAVVGVARLEDNKRATSFMAEIRIQCRECGTPFQFLGLAPGCDTQGARVSVDGLEANIAIVPEGTVPSPLDQITFNLKKGYDA